MALHDGSILLCVPIISFCVRFLEILADVCFGPKADIGTESVRLSPNAWEKSPSHTRGVLRIARQLCLEKTVLTIGRCPLLWSLLGAKRTWLIAPHMSAFDPKRT